MDCVNNGDNYTNLFTLLVYFIHSRVRRRHSTDCCVLLHRAPSLLLHDSAQLREFLGKLRGPANSPPEAGSIRHLRPVNSPPLAAGTEPLGEAEPSLTNNFIW